MESLLVTASRSARRRAAHHAHVGKLAALATRIRHLELENLLLQEQHQAQPIEANASARASSPPRAIELGNLIAASNAITDIASQATGRTYATPSAALANIRPLINKALANQLDRLYKTVCFLKHTTPNGITSLLERLQAQLMDCAEMDALDDSHAETFVGSCSHPKGKGPCQKGKNDCTSLGTDPLEPCLYNVMDSLTVGLELTPFVGGGGSPHGSSSSSNVSHSKTAPHDGVFSHDAIQALAARIEVRFEVFSRRVDLLEAAAACAAQVPHQAPIQSAEHTQASALPVLAESRVSTLLHSSGVVSLPLLALPVATPRARGHLVSIVPVPTLPCLTAQTCPPVNWTPVDLVQQRCPPVLVLPSLSLPQPTLALAFYQTMRVHLFSARRPERSAVNNLRPWLPLLGPTPLSVCQLSESLSTPPTVSTLLHASGAVSLPELAFPAAMPRARGHLVAIVPVPTLPCLTAQTCLPVNWTPEVLGSSLFLVQQRRSSVLLLPPLSRPRPTLTPAFFLNMRVHPHAATWPVRSVVHNLRPWLSLLGPTPLSVCQLSESLSTPPTVSILLHSSAVASLPVLALSAAMPRARGHLVAIFPVLTLPCLTAQTCLPVNWTPEVLGSSLFLRRSSVLLLPPLSRPRPTLTPAFFLNMSAPPRRYSACAICCT